MMNREGIGMTSQRTRQRMIERLREQGIGDERVLIAMAQIPRHLFVEEGLAHRAYEDTALPISHGQTISQPWVVARMTEIILAHAKGEKILELGTGSGYQAAVLGCLFKQVFSVERIDQLTKTARRRLVKLGYQNVRCKTGDGFSGWSNEAPFDLIIGTAAPTEPPLKLLDQLTADGMMILPVGDNKQQQLTLIHKQAEGHRQQLLDPVTFVPLLTGVIR